MAMDAGLVTRAIVVWLGWGRAAWPDRNEASLVAEFGTDVAVDVLPEVRRLERDFYASDARRVAADLSTMGDQAAAEFRARHPEIGAEAVEALAWSYTFDYR